MGSHDTFTSNTIPDEMAREMREWMEEKGARAFNPELPCHLQGYWKNIESDFKLQQELFNKMVATHRKYELQYPLVITVVAQDFTRVLIFSTKEIRVADWYNETVGWPRDNSYHTKPR